MSFLLDKTNSFKNGIILIEKNLKSTQGNSEEFNFINPIFNKYIKDLHISTEIFNEQVTLPIQQFIESFTFATDISLNSFNQIKNNLIENKQKVIKARDVYYNYIQDSNKIKNKEHDTNELFKAKKDNYAQLYKYEVDKMNEIIDKNNQKYIDAYKSLNSLNFSYDSFSKNLFNKFIKNIENFGNLFIKFSEQLNESLNSHLKLIENKTRYTPQLDPETKRRFNYESFEEFGKLKKSVTDNINIIYPTLKLEKGSSLPYKGFDDFEIIDSPIEIMDKKKVEEKIDELNNLIKKFPLENELIPSEISKLMNILKEEPIEKEETFSFIFLNNLKKFYKNRVISFKNRQNFIHLSNIMNNICIKENTIF